MNVITSKAAYSFYPYATFELQCSLVTTRDASPPTTAALEKYASRGFRMLDPGTPTLTVSVEEAKSFFIGLRRSHYDCHCWIIPFNKGEVSHPMAVSLDDEEEEEVQDEDCDTCSEDWDCEHEGEDNYNPNDYESHHNLGEEDEEEVKEEVCGWLFCADALPLRIRDDESVVVNDA